MFIFLLSVESFDFLWGQLVQNRQRNRPSCLNRQLSNFGVFDCLPQNMWNGVIGSMNNILHNVLSAHRDSSDLNSA